MYRATRRKLASYYRKFQFYVLRNLLLKYNVKFCFKDSLNIISSRDPNDNFRYMFETGYSCDAVPMMEKLNSKVFPASVCFDIGANIGITTVWLARQANIVHAFEPVRNNQIRLLETLELNNIRNVTLHRIAVAETTSKRDLFLYNSYGHHSLSENHVSEPVGKETIQTTTIDMFCRDYSINQIDIIKVDVEGFENEVLKGASSMLTDKKIKYIIFEHSKLLMEKQGRSPDQVFSTLASHGYKVFTLEGTELQREDMFNLGQEDLYATI